MTDLGSEIPYFARTARASANVDLSATVGPEAISVLAIAADAFPAPTTIVLPFGG